MLEFMFELSDKLGLSSYSTQMGIVYLDKLIDKFGIDKIKKQTHLWAIALLLIASKFMELDTNIPFIDDFKKHCSKIKYTYNSIVR
jgi:hypothetical protein